MRLVCGTQRLFALFTIMSPIINFSYIVTGELVNWFIDTLYTPLGTTSNYIATSNLHTLQITTTNIKSSPACNVFNSLFLTTVSNSTDSSASRSHLVIFISSFSVGTEYELNFRVIGVRFRAGTRDFFLFTSSDRPPIQWYRGYLSRVNTAKAWSSRPSDAQVKNTPVSISVSPIRLCGVLLN
jgi:hypothetical protein